MFNNWEYNICTQCHASPSIVISNVKHRQTSLACLHQRRLLELDTDVDSHCCSIYFLLITSVNVTPLLPSQVLCLVPRCAQAGPSVHQSSAGRAVTTDRRNSGMPAPAATSWRGPIPLYTLELAPARAFSWLKAPTSAFTFTLRYTRALHTVNGHGEIGNWQCKDHRLR